MKLFKVLLPFFFLILLLPLFLKPVLAQSEVTINVNAGVVKNTDFAQLLGGYINTRGDLNPGSKYILSLQPIIDEAKKMFPQAPEFPNGAVMRTQSNKMLSNDYFAITDAEVEDIINFCSQAGCDPMFGALGEGPVETHNGVTGKVIDTSPTVIKQRAAFVKAKCQQYFGDDRHCLNWDIGNEPPSPKSNCEYYGRILIPQSIRAIKEIIPNAVIHSPELYLDSAKVREEPNVTIGECVMRELQNTAPDLKVDAVTTHWYPYACTTTPLNITGDLILNWNGNNGPAYQKMTYPNDIVAGMKPWMQRYSVSQNSAIGIGELNPMGNCRGLDAITERLNITWGGAFWHLDELGIMAEAGIKYSQKHIHISGSGGTYEAIVVNQGRALKTPAYYAYRFYSQYFGRKIVESLSANPENLNSHASIDKDGNLRLILINKSHPGATIKAKINLSAFNVSSAMGTVYKMTVPGFGETPSGFDAESVYSSAAISTGRNFDYVVPPYTAVIIKITGAATADSCPNGNLGNINCDSSAKIDETDLEILLSKWGAAPNPPTGQYTPDLNGNNIVDQADVNILLSNFNP